MHTATLASALSTASWQGRQELGSTMKVKGQTLMSGTSRKVWTSAPLSERVFTEAAEPHRPAYPPRENTHDDTL